MFFLKLILCYLALVLLFTYNRLEGYIMSLGHTWRNRQCMDMFRKKRLCGNCDNAVKKESSTWGAFPELICKYQGKVNFFQKVPHCKDFQLKEW